jgi:hypothetical protein
MWEQDFHARMHGLDVDIVPLDDDAQLYWSSLDEISVERARSVRDEMLVLQHVSRMIALDVHDEAMAMTSACKVPARQPWNGPNVAAGAAPWCVLLGDTSLMSDWTPRDMHCLRGVCSAFRSVTSGAFFSSLLSKYGLSTTHYDRLPPRRMFELSCAVHRELKFVHDLRRAIPGAHVAGSHGLHRLMLAEGMEPGFSPVDVDVFVSGQRADFATAVSLAKEFVHDVYPEAQGRVLPAKTYCYEGNNPSGFAYEAEAAATIVDEWRANPDPIMQTMYPDESETLARVSAQLRGLQQVGKLDATAVLPRTHSLFAMTTYHLITQVGQARPYSVGRLCKVAPDRVAKFRFQSWPQVKHGSPGGDAVPTLAHWSPVRVVNVVELIAGHCVDALEAMRQFDMLQCQVSMEVNNGPTFLYTGEVLECVRKREIVLTEYAVAPPKEGGQREHAVAHMMARIRKYERRGFSVR